MRVFKLIAVFVLLISTSCSSLKVRVDYDTKTDFSEYKSFAFYKKGIDKATASDLDKKRILRAIDTELTAKGMSKAKSPDILVSIFTKSRERVNVTQNNFYGWGWNPWMYNPFYNNININQYTEGTLFIDIIDKKKSELIWQGIGSGALRMTSPEKREARIQQFVKEILSKFPPAKN